MKYIWFFLSLLILLGCEREREERTIHIAVSLAGSDAISSVKHIQGITDAAENENIELSWRTARWDYELQYRHIDTLLADDPDIIVIEIANPHKSNKIFERIEQQRIPVIGFNRLATAFQYDLVVNPDYQTIGVELAEAIIDTYDSQDTNVLFLHDLLFGDHGKSIVESFLSTIENHSNFKIKTVEASHQNEGPDIGIELPDITEQLQKADAAIATNPHLTRSLAQEIKMMDEAGIEHKSPLIAGIGGDETSIMIDYDNLLLIDRQPYTAGIYLIDAASDYIRGEFRHLEGPVLRIGDYIIPVVYTQHRIIRSETNN